jgi:hypothetical protein
MRSNHHFHHIFWFILIATACQSGPEQSTILVSTKLLALTELDRWASSTMQDSANILRIAIHNGDNYRFISAGHRDHKPVWSAERDMITFFRATGETDAKPFHLYRTQICVVNSDGTGFRELTDATNPNVNPTWTRDGTNMILFNRLSKSKFGNARIFMISPNAEINDTLLISNPEKFEWVESGLKDGRIFIFRINRAKYVMNHIIPFVTWPNVQSYHILDPATRTYYSIKRPNKYPTHKLSLSPSETKVVYMKDFDGKLHTYNDAIIAYAEFDSESLGVKNEVEISTRDKDHIDMYPRWSADENYIIFSSSRGGNMWDMKQYLYSLNSGETHEIPLGDLILDMYPCFDNLPK